MRVLGAGEATVLLIASIHGNEPAGTPLLERLGDYLASHPELLHGRRVVLVPVVNPDGVARGTRGNARGVDLNRNFPAVNRRDSAETGTALSEPESRALAEVVGKYPPSHAVSIHQPLVCVDYDGPGLELAKAMSKRCFLPVKRLGSRPGSFGSYLGVDRGVPVVTLELPREASEQDAEDLWRRYGAALIAAVRFSGR